METREHNTTSMEIMSSENQELYSSTLRMYVNIGKTLIQQEKIDDFRELILQLNTEGKFRCYMEDEDFLAMYLKYKMHLGHYLDIFHILQNVENANDPIFIDIWDEAHYRHYSVQNGGNLTPMHKFRIRQRNPPPHGICPDGVRLPVRLTESSITVMREWYSAHSTYPYPCRKAKQALAKRAGISVTKVNNWFSNARRKHRKQHNDIDRPDGKKETVTGKSHREADTGVETGCTSAGPMDTGIDLRLEGIGREHHKKLVLNLGEAFAESLVTKEERSNNIYLVTFSPFYTEYRENSICFETPFDDENSNNHVIGESARFPYTLGSVYEENVPQIVETPCVRVPFTEVQTTTNTSTSLKQAENFIFSELPVCRSHTGKPVYIERIKKPRFAQNKPKPVPVKAKHELFGNGQIQPRMKHEENQTKTKIKNMRSVWKLRVKLTKKRNKQETIQHPQPKKHQCLGMKAIDCMNSLERLCENIESSVVSPVDYACSVEFDMDESDEETDVDEPNPKSDEPNPKSDFTGYAEFNKTPVCNMNYDINNNGLMESSGHMCLDTGATGGEVVSWAEISTPYLTLHNTTVCHGGQPIGSSWCHTGVDLSTGRRFDSRSNEGGNGVAWQTYLPHQSYPSIDVTGRPLLEASISDDFGRNGNNSECYGTVVREAIQGLLNLSSSQESDCCYLD